MTTPRIAGGWPNERARCVIVHENGKPVAIPGRKAKDPVRGRLVAEWKCRLPSGVDGEWNRLKG